MYFRDYPVADVIFEASYDNLGRITDSVTTDYGITPNVTIADFDYSYVAGENNIDEIVFNHYNGIPSLDMDYDSIDRLTGINYFTVNDNEAFTMDDLGNRLSVNLRSGVGQSYTVDTANNQYSAVDSSPLSYDDAGNMTTDHRGWQYEYDYENRLQIVYDDQSNMIAYYDYDALGRRILSNNTLYYNNYNWQVCLETEFDGSSTTETQQRSFIWGNYIDEALIMTDLTVTGGSDYYYAHNHLYSPVALLEADGDVVECYEYNAYGKPTIYNAVMTQTYAVSQYDNPVLFTGRSYDSESNLYYYRYRTQNPELGRFMQNDPLGLEIGVSYANIFEPVEQNIDTLNLFEYTISNPYFFIDPLGLKVETGPLGPMPIMPGIPPIPARAKPRGKNPSECGQKAIRGITQKYPDTTVGSRDDFMRHCVASCRVAVQCGQWYSWFGGTMREYFRRGSSIGRDEDLASNSQGRAVAKCRQTSCENGCKKAFNNGGEAECCPK